jgi:hypothetical protein
VSADGGSKSLIKEDKSMRTATVRDGLNRRRLMPLVMGAAVAAVALPTSAHHGWS